MWCLTRSRRTKCKSEGCRSERRVKKYLSDWQNFQGNYVPSATILFGNSLYISFDRGWLSFRTVFFVERNVIDQSTGRLAVPSRMLSPICLPYGPHEVVRTLASTCHLSDKLTTTTEICVQQPVFVCVDLVIGHRLEYLSEKYVRARPSKAVVPSFVQEGLLL